MYLKALTIQNFRSITDMTFSFDPGINLLVGDNGVGKTSILEAAVIGLGTCFTDISGVSSTNIKTSDIRQELQIIDGSPQRLYQTPSSISCTVEIDEQTFSWSRIRKDEGAYSRMSTSYGDGPERIHEYFRRISNDPQSFLPILNYQSINRVSSTKNDDFATTRKMMDDRRCGYIGSMDSTLDHKFIRKWCYAMSRKTASRKRYDLFLSVVSSTMMALSELKEAPSLMYSEEFDDFVYSENGQTVPITFLSAGYQAVLWLVMDISFRTLLLNPSIESMEQAKGIVLIDEIDTHLHPKWQWNILGTLQKNFPNVQFIITTHAPIVISSCKNCNIIDIGDDQNIQYLPEAYGYSTDEVLRSKQASAGIPLKLRSYLADFDHAVQFDRFEDAKKIYHEMVNEFSEENSQVRQSYVTLSILLDEDEI